MFWQFPWSGNYTEAGRGPLRVDRPCAAWEGPRKRWSGTNLDHSCLPCRLDRVPPPRGKNLRPWRTERGRRQEAIFATEKRREPGRSFASLLRLFPDHPGSPERRPASTPRRQVVCAMVQIRHKVTGAVLLEVHGDSLTGGAHRQEADRRKPGRSRSHRLQSEQLRPARSRLTGATLERTILNAVSLNNADLSHANLDGATSPIRAWSASISRTLLCRANFRYCKLEGAVLVKPTARRRPEYGRPPRQHAGCRPSQGRSPRIQPDGRQPDRRQPGRRGPQRREHDLRPSLARTRPRHDRRPWQDRSRFRGRARHQSASKPRPPPQRSPPLVAILEAGIGELRSPRSHAPRGNDRVPLLAASSVRVALRPKGACNPQPKATPGYRDIPTFLSPERGDIE